MEELKTFENVPVVIDQIKDQFIKLQRLKLKQESQIDQLNEQNFATTSEIFLGIIDVLDLIERWEESKLDAEIFLSKTKKRLEKLLLRHEVEEVHVSENVIDRVDVKIVETRADRSRRDGDVLDLLRKGYRLKGRMIREPELITCRNE